MLRSAPVSSTCERSLLAALLSCACAPEQTAATVRNPAEPSALEAPATEPIVIGEAFTIQSEALGETRRINVFVPSIYGARIDAPMSVLYMLDGGTDEDFLHVAGLVQVSVSNGSMRPFMVVGIQNTQRHRDMTGPTTIEEDRAIAPVVGGSAAFRRFLADELVPAVKARWRTTDESALVGESLAGLFVVETFVLEPDLFDLYIAMDPSLWWADAALVASAAERLPAHTLRGKAIFLASSNEPTLAKLVARFADILAAHRATGLASYHEHFPAESHATLYHPAALRAFRRLFAPRSSP
jgi:predicted alpha/beta superfamily hydrolase